MSWERPLPAVVWKAIATYIAHAHRKEPPSAVRERLETLRSLPEEEFFDCAVFEHDPGPDPPAYRLRLGNQFYPHMKLMIGRSPDGKHHLFHADTHDQHCCPDAKSRDYRLFLQLMENNQQIAQKIEAAWEAEGLPTFKSYLRGDLARRKKAAETENGG